ncbi:MAG: M20/M25/M40 family metallo-hydrolase [Thermoanaerobaculia bacterium]
MRHVARSFVAFALLAAAAAAQLDPVEQAIVAAVDAQSHELLEQLEALVDVNSGTMNHAGVREVGAFFERELAALGFATRWVEMPAEMQRAGHLFAERDGDRGPTILLIGHLDTVFEPDSPFQSFRREGDIAHGPGTEDMKGGNLVILHALSALEAAGALDGTRIIVALTGDEEELGAPLEIARRDLIEAGRRADLALGFEAAVGDIHTGTIARRGASRWTLTVTGTPAHSSQIFDERYGAGAIFEASRILAAWYGQLRGERYLTFNPGVILGGTTVAYDGEGKRGTAFGKTNVIAETAVVEGDLRTISPEQLERARETMRRIVALSLPGTRAEITFADGYPPMPPTEANVDLLSQLDQVNRDLGFGAIEPLDPGLRGAADVSFVAADVDAALDGLGPVGWDGHTTSERIDVTTLPVAVKRVAVLLYRLTR